MTKCQLRQSFRGWEIGLGRRSQISRVRHLAIASRTRLLRHPCISPLDRHPRACPRGSKTKRTEMCHLRSPYGDRAWFLQSSPRMTAGGVAVQTVDAADCLHKQNQQLAQNSIPFRPRLPNPCLQSSRSVTDTPAGVPARRDRRWGWRNDVNRHHRGPRKMVSLRRHGGSGKVFGQACRF